MKIGKSIMLAMAAVLLIGSWAAAVPFVRDEAKDVRDSAAVIQELVRIPEKGIPPAVLRNAKAVVIIPDEIKGAFIVGGRHGTGVALIRTPNGGWSDPLFISITGGSVGWQIGGKATDLILVFKGLKGVESMMKGKITLGADASIAAGPVGRTAEAATDVMLRSEILSYSRSRGLFGGVSLEGAALLVSDDADAKFYGRPISPQEIVAGKTGKTSPDVRHLKQVLNKYSTRR